MRTEHAPAGRETTDRIHHQNEHLASDPVINVMLAALPHPVFIVNSKRQIVHYHIPEKSPITVNGFRTIPGMRPGEVLDCVNHETGDDGCGTAVNCRYCNMVNTLIECIETGIKRESEVQIRAHDATGDRYYNFKVTAAPLPYKENIYYMVSLLDNSSEKRREILESVFFHDILNTATGILGHLEYAIDFPGQTEDDSLDQSHKILEFMIQQIKDQRDLLRAENRQLKPLFSACSSKEILQAAIGQVSFMETASGKEIKVNTGSTDFRFQTDSTILIRILVNMLKNALEASKAGELIEIGCHETVDLVSFHVFNRTFIPEPVQAKLFNKSFSTKGSKRGIGTYSMKLFTEQVLGGKLTFESLPEIGTTFIINFNKEQQRSI
jgi:signal transduction histidine kinase